MAVHDWTLVEAGVFHDFHTVWIGRLRDVLNERLLPRAYYALAEQRAGPFSTDVLALHLTPEPPEPFHPLPPLPPPPGSIALAEAPPRVRLKRVIDAEELAQGRRIAIRHVSHHRLVALIELISPANKDRPDHVAEFALKVASALRRGVHVLVVDLFPPGPHDPFGMAGAVFQHMSPTRDPEPIPEAEPVTLTSYAAGAVAESFTEYVAVGTALPEMPLFLTPDRYINVPLEETYQATFRGMPAFWREVLLGRDPEDVIRSLANGS